MQIHKITGLDAGARERISPSKFLFIYPLPPKTRLKGHLMTYGCESAPFLARQNKSLRYLETMGNKRRFQPCASPLCSYCQASLDPFKSSLLSGFSLLGKKGLVKSCDDIKLGFARLQFFIDLYQIEMRAFICYLHFNHICNDQILHINT